MKDGFTALTLIVLIIVLIIAGPVFTIMALNTLFPSLAIPVSFWTWLSVAWLQAITIGNIASSVRKG